MRTEDSFKMMYQDKEILESTIEKREKNHTISF